MNPTNVLRGLFHEALHGLLNAYNILMDEVVRYLPDPWTDRFSLFSVFGIALGIAALSWKSGHVNLLATVVALAIAFLTWLGRKNLVTEGGISRTNQLVLGAANMLILASVLFIIKVNALEILLLYMTMIMTLFEGYLRKKQPHYSMAIIPLLWGLLTLDIGILIEAPALAGFPAILIFLLTVIIYGTRDLQKVIAAVSGASESRKAINVTRRLNVLAVSLFFFGVVSFWPWLGKLFDSTYLWILIFAVLFPVSALWGKLKQADLAHLEVRLNRFNRIVPYCAVLFLVACIFG